MAAFGIYRVASKTERQQEVIFIKKQATLTVAMLGIFSALILLMTFTPIGYLVIPGIGVSATLIHIPVIVGAVVLGPKLGTALGLVWG